MSETHYIISDRELSYLYWLTARLTNKLSPEELREIQKTLGEVTLPAIKERGAIDVDALLGV